MSNNPENPTFTPNHTDMKKIIALILILAVAAPACKKKDSSSKSATTTGNTTGNTTGTGTFTNATIFHGFFFTTRSTTDFPGNSMTMSEASANFGATPASGPGSQTLQ